MVTTSKSQQLMKKYLRLEKAANQMAERCGRGIASSEDVKDSWKLANAAWDAVAKHKRKAKTNG